MCSVSRARTRLRSSSSTRSMRSEPSALTRRQAQTARSSAFCSSCSTRWTALIPRSTSRSSWPRTALTPSTRLCSAPVASTARSSSDSPIWRAAHTSSPSTQTT
eukprot:Amastigsp_a509598_547.p4 type:complete len:104 gc:universal Amastigsp_a509598_547:564-253(-)